MRLEEDVGRQDATYDAPSAFLRDDHASKIRPKILYVGD